MLPQRRWRGVKPKKTVPVKRKEKRSELEKTINRWKEEDSEITKPIERKSSSKSSNNANKTYPIFALMILIVVIVFAIQYSKPETQEYLEDAASEINQELNSTISDTKEWVNETISDLNIIWEENIPPLTPPSPTKQELIDFALQEINMERMKQGITNVTLNTLDSAQEHAENMLNHGFLSHWGTNGFKPYMRYTISGGIGYVAENVAWQRTTGKIDPFEAISSLNWNMMYDDADSNWGHRENILDPSHNKVNIGIAWNDKNLFLVQDFEDDYFLRVEVSHIGERYGIEYETSEANWDPSQIAIYYDPWPVNLSVSELSNPPYDHSYGMGEQIGAILPDPYYLEKGITINADKWFTSNTVEGYTILSTSFFITKAYQSRGRGVYTLIIWEDGLPYTTYSIWFKGQ